MYTDYKIIESGENLLKKALADGQIIVINRLNGQITQFEPFNTEEELIEWYINEQTEKEFDFNYYRIGKEAYVLHCNSVFQDYLDEFSNDFLTDEEDVFEIRVKGRNMLTYDEVTKDIKESDFVDGFYDYDSLQIPLNGETVKYEYECLVEEGNEIIDDVFGTASFEVHFPS